MLDAIYLGIFPEDATQDDNYLDKRRLTLTAAKQQAPRSNGSPSCLLLNTTACVSLLQRGLEYD